MLTCPHCHKKDVVDQRVEYNVDNYGPGFFNVRCLNYKKIIKVGAIRKVVIVSIEPSNETETDFPD